tara:strand:+ start:7671 stop:8819 length:1149 start_codon:yes stop_codon:yes gene_type:complete
MAITITQSPQIITPSDNPITWVFQSDQTAQVNFYFMVEVQIANPTTFVAVERHKIFPESGSFAHFDASSITERYANVNSFDSSQSLLSVKIVLTEYYNGSVGASATSSSALFWKARLKKKDFVNYNYTDYFLNTVGSVKFLTFEPRGTAKVKQADLFYLSILTNGNAVDFSINTYQANGTLVDNVILSGIGSGLNYFTLWCGVNTLINFNGVDFTNATYYTIEVSNGVGSSEVFRIDLDTTCLYSTSTRLHFLNTLGSIDSYTFGLLTREKTEVKSFGYERQFGNFNSSNDFVYDVKDGTVIDFLKTSSKSLEVTSDWMKENVQNWLSKELYMSPIVWTEENAELYRCKVTNTSYDRKIQETDMVFQEVAKIELETETSVNV